MRIRLLCALLITAGGAEAQIYKCTDSAGRKQYQDQPCAQRETGTVLDLSGGNVTTIDSETSRREAQGALALREETRERVVEVTTPAKNDTSITLSGPDFDPGFEDDERYGGYPIYLDRPDRHRDRDDRRPPRRPDETPMIEPPRRAGSNYVPEPPTIRQVAPRSPAPPPPRSARPDSRDEGR